MSGCLNEEKKNDVILVANAKMSKFYYHYFRVKARRMIPMCLAVLQFWSGQWIFDEELTFVVELVELIQGLKLFLQDDD